MKKDERIEPVDEFTGDPEELMPLPTRFRKPKPEIPLEAPVGLPEAKIELSRSKDVIISTKVELYRKGGR